MVAGAAVVVGAAVVGGTVAAGAVVGAAVAAGASVASGTSATDPSSPPPMTSMRTPTIPASAITAATTMSSGRRERSGPLGSGSVSVTVGGVGATGAATG